MLVKTESPFSFNLNFTPTMDCTPTLSAEEGSPNTAIQK